MTAEYFAYSFSFYRTASESIATSLAYCSDNSLQRVVFCGVSELAEISSVRAHDFRIAIIGSFDPDSTLENFIGKPVWNRIDDIPVTDAVLFTASNSATSVYDLIRSKFAADRVVVPDIVRPLIESGAK